MKTIIESYRAGLFNRSMWGRNILAGLIVGVVALPLAMAFAVASGARPEQGLYTAIIAGLLVSVFGGTRLQIAGPTGSFVAVLTLVTARYGAEGLQIATMMAGLILFLFGALRLGAVIKFIPHPVILGFTAGIAVVIWVGQWGYFFGLNTLNGLHFHEKLWYSLGQLPHLNWHTTLIGSIALLTVLLSNRIPGIRRIPGPLWALFLAIGLQSWLQFADVATIGSAFGGIPKGLPHFRLPEIRLDRIIELVGPAFTIAMLGAIESLMSAVVADGMAGTKHDSNQELIGQGLANLLVPFFGGFAATGAIARTATNIRNGGNSPIAGIMHALTLVLIILFFAPLVSRVPLAALAAILFVVAWNMADLHSVLQLIRRAPKADVLILLMTMLLTIFVDLVVAVYIGVIIATLHFMMGMSKSIRVRAQDARDLDIDRQGLSIDELQIYTLDGPFFFASVDSLEHTLALAHAEPKVLVLQFGWVPMVDMTAIKCLELGIRDLQKRGVRVILVGLSPKIKGPLSKAGLLQKLGKENLYEHLDEALKALRA